MNILITGVAGFSGAFLARYLLERGHCLYLNFRDALKKPAIGTHPSLYLVPGNLSALENLPRDLDVVIHVAATSPTANTSVKDYIDDNIVATEKLVMLSSAAKVKKFIFFSSLSIYGDIHDPVVDEQTLVLNPNAYGMSKLYGELCLEEQSKAMPSIVLRLPAVIGRGACRHWLATILLKALKGEPITLFNPTALFNNAIHIQDLCILIEQLLMCEWIGFTPLTLGADTCLPIRTIVEKIKSTMASSSEIIITQAQKPSFIISSEKAKKEFNYKPRSIDSMLESYLIETKQSEIFGVKGCAV